MLVPPTEIGLLLFGKETREAMAVAVAPSGKYQVLESIAFLDLPEEVHLLRGIH